MKRIKKKVSGTAIRVNDDGSQERIPFVEFKIGDIVLDGDSGRKMRIITRPKLLGELKTGRFQFASHPRNWYAAYTHGCETLYYAVDPPTSPFGKGNPEHLNIKFPETKVVALTFEEVVDKPVPA